MSGPLFIRQVILDPVGIGGQILTPYAGLAWVDLIPVVAEETLIEEIRWGTQVYSTIDSELLVGAYGDAGVGPQLYAPIATYDLPAGTSTRHASGIIKLNLAVPVGWKLRVATNMAIAGPAYELLTLAAAGGILR
jgi:hypothetical protein